MVFAIEPKLWHSGQYYLRVEDMVLVGQDSSEFLTTSDRTTFEL
jgi:Xaa-Pro aminopeptidase